MFWLNRRSKQIPVPERKSYFFARKIVLSVVKIIVNCRESSIALEESEVSCGKVKLWQFLANIYRRKVAWLKKQQQKQQDTASAGVIRERTLRTMAVPLRWGWGRFCRKTEWWTTAPEEVVEEEFTAAAAADSAMASRGFCGRRPVATTTTTIIITCWGEAEARTHSPTCWCSVIRARFSAMTKRLDLSTLAGTWFRGWAIIRWKLTG